MYCSSGFWSASLRVFGKTDMIAQKRVKAPRNPLWKTIHWAAGECVACFPRPTDRALLLSRRDNLIMHRRAFWSDVPKPRARALSSSSPKAFLRGIRDSTLWRTNTQQPHHAYRLWVPLPSKWLQFHVQKLILTIRTIYIKKNGAFHLERRESKSKARVGMNKDIEMNPKADDCHPSTNEA